MRDDPSRLSIRLGPEAFVARLATDLAPASCSRLKALLPYRGRAAQARWSGQSLWAPLGAAWPAGEQLPAEQALHEPRPGQILLYAGAESEPEILIPYGTTRFACVEGPLAGNPVLVIESGLERLAALGHEAMWRGALDFHIG